MAMSGKSVCVAVTMLVVWLLVATLANGDDGEVSKNDGQYDKNAPEHKAGQWDEEKWGWKRYEKNGGNHGDGGEMKNRNERPAATEEKEGNAKPAAIEEKEGNTKPSETENDEEEKENEEE